MAFDGPYKINLEVNLAIRGTLTNIYYLPERKDDIGKTWDAQWEMKGVWQVASPDGDWSAPQETRVFINVPQLETGPVELGLAKPNGERMDKKTGKSVPAFVVLYHGQIRISKQQEKGSKRHLVTLSRVGEQAAPKLATVQEASQVRYAKAGPSMTVPKELLPAFYGQTVPVTADIDEWAALEARYARCAKIAIRTWCDKSDDEDGPPMDAPALVAAAATLFIECNKEHLQTAVLAPPVQIPVSARAPSVGDPTEAQINQLRELLNSGVFSKEERQEWLAKIYGATQYSMMQDIERLKRMLTIRNAGPGHPSSFASVPPALERGDASDLSEDLPF